MFHSASRLDAYREHRGSMPLCSDSIQREGTEVTAGGSLWEGGTSVMMPEPEYSLSKDPGEITGL